MGTKQYLDVAILAAKRAGKIHRKYFHTHLRKKKKTQSFNLLTVADVEAEKAIVSTIKKSFPKHNFLAEEGQYRRTKSPYRWIVDPLDGTNNFCCGLPIFCASVALAKDDEVIIGAVYDVTRDELFYARKGKGAYFNGKRIAVSRAKKLRESLLITGFYYDRGKMMVENLEHIRKFFVQNIIGLRRMGAAALDLCYVACGRAAGFWEFELHPWDFAAGMLFIEEAGGRVTDRDGKKVSLEPSYIVASNGLIHRQMLKTLRK